MIQSVRIINLIDQILLLLEQGKWLWAQPLIKRD